MQANLILLKRRFYKKSKAEKENKLAKGGG